MIQFVNAKINIGLSVVGRRADGYHDLETIFFPIGLHNGKPENPTHFCDVLEAVRLEGGEPFDVVEFTGRHIDCNPEQNLVTKALRTFREECAGRGVPIPRFGVRLEKHLPDGAGLGGGSADASFTLRVLNEISGNPLDKGTLLRLAGKLGADCPVFIENRPIFASGTGDRFEPTAVDLGGWWVLIVKPDIYVSTREAFAGIKPQAAAFDLRRLGDYPVEAWKDMVKNDFETSIFPLYPELAEIKKELYRSGAVYASMSGSGSALYGLYPSETSALSSSGNFVGHQTYLCAI